MWNAWNSAPPLPSGNNASFPQYPAPPPTAQNVAAPVPPTAFAGAANSQYSQYTEAQFAALSPEQQLALQQHWQQWQKYQEEYAKWHAQYGEQYNREMAAAMGGAGQPPTATTYPSFYPQQPPLPPPDNTQQPQQPQQPQPPPQPAAKISGQPQIYNQAPLPAQNSAPPQQPPPLPASNTQPQQPPQYPPSQMMPQNPPVFPNQQYPPQPYRPQQFAPTQMPPTPMQPPPMVNPQYAPPSQQSQQHSMPFMNMNQPPPNFNSPQHGGLTENNRPNDPKEFNSNKNESNNSDMQGNRFNAPNHNNFGPDNKQRPPEQYPPQHQSQDMRDNPRGKFGGPENPPENFNQDDNNDNNFMAGNNIRNQSNRPNFNFGPGGSNLNNSGGRNFNTNQGGNDFNNPVGRNFSNNQEGSEFNNPSGRNFNNQGGNDFNNPGGRNFNNNQRGNDFNNPSGRNFNNNQGGNDFNNSGGRNFNNNQRGNDFNNPSGRNFNNNQGDNDFNNPGGRNFNNQGVNDFNNPGGRNFNNSQRGNDFNSPSGGRNFNNQRENNFNNNREGDNRSFGPDGNRWNNDRRNQNSGGNDNGPNERENFERFPNQRGPNTNFNRNQDGGKNEMWQGNQRGERDNFQNNMGNLGPNNNNGPNRGGNPNFNNNVGNPYNQGNWSARGPGQGNLPNQNREGQRAPEMDEESFERLFRQWEEQFENWKKANVNNPDREMYQRYEMEFEKQRRRIIERRDQMRRRKMEQAAMQEPKPQDQSNNQREAEVTERSISEKPDDEKAAEPKHHDNVVKTGELQEIEMDEDSKNLDSTGNNASADDGANAENAATAEDADYADDVENAENAEDDENADDADKVEDPEKVSEIESEGKNVAETPEPSQENRSSGKRKSRFDAPVQNKTARSITPTEIITLDDDDDYNESPATQKETGTMSALFKKTDDIPGLDLVDENIADKDQTKEIPPNSVNPSVKKIPSLFDIVITKPDDLDEPQREIEINNQRKSNVSGMPVITSVTTPDIASSLKDPDFIKKISEALAKAQGKEVPDQNALPPQQFLQQLPALLQQVQSAKGDRAQYENDANNKNLSFSEWQSRKMHDNPGSSSSFLNADNREQQMDPKNLPDSIIPFGNDKNTAGPMNIPNMGGFGPNNRPGFENQNMPFFNGPGSTEGPGFGGPNSGRFGPGNEPNFGGNNMNFRGPGGFGGNEGRGPNDGPNFNDRGGQNFGGRGGQFGPNGGQFGPNNGPNFGGRFGPNDGPNNSRFGPNVGPNFGGNNGPFGGPNGPMGGRFGPRDGQNFGDRSNQNNSRFGPNDGRNFGGPNMNDGRNFGGPNSNDRRNFGGPNPNDRRSFGGPNLNDERNFGGPNGPGGNFGPNNRASFGGFNPNFDDNKSNGSKEEENKSGPSSIIDTESSSNSRNANNPFRRSGGPDVPLFDAADKKNDLNSSRMTGSAAGSRQDDFFRPMQVIDYQNTSLAPKVIDYGHKKSAADFCDDFMPVKTFDYGHSSNPTINTNIRNAALPNRFGQGQPVLNKNPNQNPNQNQNSNRRNKKRKNKKKNANNAADTVTAIAGGSGNKKEQPEVKGCNEQQNKPSHDSNIAVVQQRVQAETTEDKFNDYNKEALEEISDNEDDLADDGIERDDESPPPPPPPMFPSNVSYIPSKQGYGNIGGANDSIFPSTACANKNVKEISANHLQMSIPTASNLNTIAVDEILLNPGRFSRPKKICIVLRGPPGSGKSHMARLIKEKENEMGGANPRILSIDDYFLVENDFMEKDPKTGKTLPRKEMLYEYDKGMEETYMQYLIKQFKKTIADNLYDFIIIDCNNNSLRSLNEFYCHSKDSGFTPYIVDLKCDLETCLSRNIHNRSESDIKSVLRNWNTTPLHYIKLDCSTLLENLVEMEDAEDMVTEKICSDEETFSNDGMSASKELSITENEAEDDSNEAADDNSQCGFLKSKWENDTTTENLARLDGTSKLMTKRKATMEDFLQTDEWEPPRTSSNGKKRVRWADIEEKRAQDKMRAIGFVVGQTDWKRMMDPNAGSRALNQTKYIERVNKKGNARKF